MTGKPFEITVISGKGGTGKTTICAAFARIDEENAVLCDLDVDASNLPLIIGTRERERIPFTGLDIAIIDNDRCTGCGLCHQKCKFGGINSDIEVIFERCEGCGVCYLVCPEEAISMAPREDGYLVVSETEKSLMVHGDLLPGGEGSGKLVSLIRERATEIAKINGNQMIISDGPPGIGCPVISSLTGTDLALVVTEPSISGLSDLKRILELCRHFNVEVEVMINRYDIDHEASDRIEKLLMERSVHLLGRIPFDRDVLDSLDRGMTIVENPDSRTGQLLREIWQNIKDRYINCREPHS